MANNADDKILIFLRRNYSHVFDSNMNVVKETL